MTEVRALGVIRSKILVGDLWGRAWSPGASCWACGWPKCPVSLHHKWCSCLSRGFSRTLRKHDFQPKFVPGQFQHTCVGDRSSCCCCTLLHAVCFLRHMYCLYLAWLKEPSPSPVCKACPLPLCILAALSSTPVWVNLAWVWTTCVLWPQPSVTIGL